MTEAERRTAGRIMEAWRSFTSGGLDDDPTTTRGRRLKFFNIFFLVTSVFLTAFGVVNLLHGSRENGLYELAIAATGVAILVYGRASTNLDLAQNLALTMTLVIMTFLTFTGGMEATGIYWWFCLPAGAFYLAGRRGGWLWVGISAGILVATMVLQSVGAIAVPYSTVALRQLLAAYLLVSFLVFAYESIRESYERRLERTTGQVISANRKLTAEIAERERAEQALVAAQQQAERANRAKSEFLSRMSHELRTPMNSILGFAQLMEADTAEPLSPANQDKLRHILVAGRHLLGLINEVLDLARIEAGRIELELGDVAVQPLLAETIELIEPLARQRRLTVQDCTGSGPRLVARADPTRLKQILLNLLSNAVKYNREGGLIRVECEERPGSRLLLRVADTGSGITEEHKAVIFEPFSRLASDHAGVEGTGIGLAIVKKLAVAMGGDVGLTSSPGLGTCFTVELPAAARSSVEPQQATPTPVAADEARGTHGVVLYVEDDIANLTLVKHLLRSRPGLALLHAPTGRQGLEMAAQYRPDLILLDLHLPDLDGREVLRQLREGGLDPAVQVIVVSASAMPRDIEEVSREGVFRYLTKPLDIKVFLQTLDAALTVAGPTVSREGGGA